MDSEEFLFWVTMAVFLSVFGMVLYGTTVTPYESINVDTLDNVCKELYNNTDATFYEELGLSSKFGCKINNTVIFIDKCDKEID